VRVSDGHGNLATREVDIVSDNQAPTIEALGAGAYRVRPGESSSLTAVISDDDGDEVTCGYRIGAGDFRGTLDDPPPTTASTCLATFSATSSRNGLVTIAVEATDSHGARSSGELVLRVARVFTVVGFLDTSPLWAYALDYTTDGRIFVSDVADKVTVFSTSGSKLSGPTEVPSDFGTLHTRALAVDRTLPTEPIYLSSQNSLHHDSVFVYDQNLIYQETWNVEPCPLPHFLLVRPDGSVLISSNDGARILVRNPDGSVETFATGVNTPRQLARDPLTGNIYVTNKGNPRIVVLDNSGNYVREWRGVNGDFQEPHGVAVDRRHEIVVVADTNGNRLQVFDLEGNYLLTWSSPAVHVPRYTIVGPDGLFYVASAEDFGVHVLDYQ